MRNWIDRETRYTSTYNNNGIVLFAFTMTAIDEMRTLIRFQGQHWKILYYNRRINYACDRRASLFYLLSSLFTILFSPGELQRDRAYVAIRELLALLWFGSLCWQAGRHNARPPMEPACSLPLAPHHSPLHLYCALDILLPPPLGRPTSLGLSPFSPPPIPTPVPSPPPPQLRPPPCAPLAMWKRSGRERLCPVPENGQSAWVQLSFLFPISYYLLSFPYATLLYFLYCLPIVFFLSLLSYSSHILVCFFFLLYVCITVHPFISSSLLFS